MDTSRRLRKRQQTHNSIMHSAKVLFEERGISNVTIDMITDGADVSRSTFFNHFASLDDLLSSIANEEINDILKPDDDGRLPDVRTIFERLNRDTYPYPQLMCELVVRSVISGKKSSVSEIKGACRGDIAEMFTSREVPAMLFGSYLGLVFNKILTDSEFGDPKETNDKIQNFIGFMTGADSNNE